MRATIHKCNTHASCVEALGEGVLHLSISPKLVMLAACCHYMQGKKQLFTNGFLALAAWILAPTPGVFIQAATVVVDDGAHRSRIGLAQASYLTRSQLGADASGIRSP